MDSEVLVHVNAPARFIDDKRYAAIARNVLDFEAANTLRLSDIVAHKHNVRDGFQSKSPPQFNSQAGILTQGQPQAVEAIITRNEVIKTNRNPLTRTRKTRNPQYPTKSSRESQASLGRFKTNNPPFRSPLHDRPINLNCGRSLRHQILPETPFAQADQREKILVPNTEIQKCKQFSSHLFSPYGEMSHILNSKSTPSNDLSTVTQSLQPRPNCEAESFAWQATQGALEASPRRRAIKVKKAVTPNLLIPTTKANEDRGVVPTAAFTPIVEHRLNALSTVLPSDPDQSSCSAVHDIDATPRGVPMVVDGDDSTLTMSETSPLDPGHVGTVNAASPTVQRSTLIDLVTPDTTISKTLNTDSPQRNTDPYDLGFDRSCVSDGSSNATRYSSTFAAIQSLPVGIDPPDLALHQLSVPTHKTPILQATAHGLSLPECFRPQSMSRGLADGERGYWKVPITIVTPEEARSIRKQTAEQSKGMDSPALKPLLKHDGLTEDEFISVWEDLTKFISSGSVGWSIRLLRRNFVVLRNKETRAHNALFHLQVYSYAGAIPYVYAMLLVCTRMHVLCKPLQWFSALDEKPVITMTGDTRRKGDLGLWTQTVDDRGGCFWICR